MSGDFEGKIMKATANGELSGIAGKHCGRLDQAILVFILCVSEMALVINEILYLGC